MTKKQLLQSTAFAGLLAVGGFAHACATLPGAWIGGKAGDAVAGGPGTPENLIRYSGECAMEASDGFVQDDTPADEERMISRFYFYPEGGGSATIYRTLTTAVEPEQEGTPVYEVTYDGASETITVTSLVAGGGATSALPVEGSNWNSVEIDWQSGGDMLVYVNVDATEVTSPTGTAAAGTGSISAARLGTMSPSGTISALYDDYEARRTTNVGRLLVGDANGDGTVNSGDIVAVILEFFGEQIATGTPDANEDGTINSGDIVGIILIFFNQA